MDQRDRYVANLNHVAPVVLHELVGREATGAHHPWRLVALHVHWTTTTLKKRRYALDMMTAERTADVVGVEMCGQHAGHLHAVGLDNVE